MLINSKTPFHCVYIDQKAAFDRIPHQKLLDRSFDHAGIHPKSRAWIESFLTSRQFIVVVDSRASSARPAKFGAPQGSCLSPIPYTIFVSDMRFYLPAEIENQLFADGLKLFAAIRSRHDAEVLQLAIDKVMRWCLDNDKTISVSKSAVIQFGPVKTSYLIEGAKFPFADYVKDLGVTFTACLNFSKHVHDICKSPRCLINTIFRCFVIQDCSVYMHLYSLTRLFRQWS